MLLYQLTLKIRDQGVINTKNDEINYNIVLFQKYYLAKWITALNIFRYTISAFISVVITEVFIFRRMLRYHFNQKSSVNYNIFDTIISP